MGNSGKFERSINIRSTSISRDGTNTSCDIGEVKDEAAESKSQKQETGGGRGTEISNSAISIDVSQNLKQKRKIRKKQLKKLEKLAKLHIQKQQSTKEGGTETDKENDVPKAKEAETCTLDSMYSNKSNSGKSTPAGLTRVKTKALIEMLQNEQEIANPGVTNKKCDKENKKGTKQDNENIITKGSTLVHGMNVDASLAEFAVENDQGSDKQSQDGDVNDDNNITIENEALDIQSDTGMIMRQESSAEDIMFAKMLLLDEIRLRLFDKFFKYVCLPVLFVCLFVLACLVDLVCIYSHLVVVM